MPPNEPGRDGYDLLDPARSASLSGKQRELVVQAVLAQGPALIRRARHVQIAQRTAVAGCMAAAAALIVMNLRHDAEPSLSPMMLAAAPARACDTDPINIRPAFSYDAASRGHLALGERASVVTESGADAAVVSSTSCATVLSLKGGEATLRARDLRGGSLQVETPYGDMAVVTTSLLRVRVLAASVVISVAEGEVSIMRAARLLTTVSRNQSLELDGEGGVSTSPLSAEDSGRMRSALTLFQEARHPEAPAEPESVRTPRTSTQGKRVKRAPLLPTEPSDSAQLSPANQLAQAEARWRAGEISDARALFREAARDPGPTGEAAWVRLSRLELSRRDASAALSALQHRSQRGGASVLEAEAMWLEVQALQMSGRPAHAEARARELVRSFGSSPQALAARRYLQKK